MGFYKEKQKQNKAFVRSLRKWLLGRQYTDTQVGTFLASSLTHVFIEIDHGHLEYYRQYKVSEQCRKLSEFVDGTLNQADMRQFYQRIVGEELQCSGPSEKE